MNYKHVISFLGREQQKMWGKPISSWIVIKSLGERTWTKEFQPTKSPGFQGNASAIFLGGYGQTFSSDFEFKNKQRLDLDPIHTDMEFYYNTDADVVFCIRQEHLDLKEKLLDRVDESIKKNESIRRVGLNEL